MMSVLFDLARLEVIGNPVPVVEGVAVHQSNGAANFSFSDGGWLAFVAGGAIESVSHPAVGGFPGNGPAYEASARRLGSTPFVP